MSEVSGEQYGAERCRVYVSDEDEVGLQFVTEAVYQAVKVAAGVDGGAIIPQQGRWYNDSEPGFVVEIVYPISYDARRKSKRVVILAELGEVKAKYGNTFFATFEPVVAAEVF